MSVLRRFAHRVYQLWSHSFLRLRHPGRYLKRRLHHRCSPWLSSAQQFLLLDSADDGAATVSQTAKQTANQAANQTKKKSSKGSTKQTIRSTKQSTGHTLIVSPNKSRRAWTITLLAVLLLATCMGQRFYRQPGLDVRSLSSQTFYAPAAATVEDKRATELRRDDVRNGAVQVLKIDPERTAAAERSLRTLLRQGRELRDQAGRPNFINLETLSQSTQDFLFQASDTQWETTWRLAKMQSLSVEQLSIIAESRLSDSEASDNQNTTPADTQSNTQGQNRTENRTEILGDKQEEQPDDSPDNSSDNLSANDETEPSQQPENRGIASLPVQITAELSALSSEQFFALRELVAYRDLSGNKGLSLLQTRVGTRRSQYRKAYEDLVAAASTQNQPLYNYRLFELSESQWSTLETNALTIFNEMMLQGVSEGTPDDMLRRAIEARVPVEPSIEVRQLTADVLAASIVPNLTKDEERTRQELEQAVRQIDPVMVSVNEGDLIVRANEVIDSSDFVLLDHFDLTDRYFNWIGLCGFGILVVAAVALYLWVDHRQQNQLNQRDHYLVVLLCLAVSLLAALNFPTLGLPAVGLLVGSFYGAPLGMTVVGLITLVLPIGAGADVVSLISGAAAALLGTWIAPQLRSREEFALLGGVVGLSQAIVHLILTLMRSTIAAPLWKAVFVGSAMHGLYGIAWSIVALGVSPYLEHFFDVVTPIRLAELANPNRPLLKRLAAEAPGTFQHTMFVANLAEAAARALGRNVELVRAGTLYHDIGKMHAPQGFIENQMGGPNLHDALDDPWESANIIKKHVTQGLVMARKYRLPKAVQAFIPEHQGDMKISYFYQQAKAKQEKEPTLVVNAADFSYDGPIPQSPETGITMLADSCEAALRSLPQEASMDEAYAMVNKILRARWRNRQLIESGLRRDDMDVIASVFIQVWQQHNHKRIAYPKNVFAGQES
ncbi:MAG: HDIG domain-containing metalloprotein [Cyanobacteria bacterium J06607_10]